MKLAAMMCLEGKIKMCPDQPGHDSSLLHDRLVLQPRLLHPLPPMHVKTSAVSSE